MKEILFVCTANTCRSFMAEALMKKMLKEADISSFDVRVSSAGLFAVEDDEPVEEALEVLEEIYDVDGARHRAQEMTEELSEDSDYIIAMDAAHKEALLEAYPNAEGKIYTLLELAYGEDGLDGALDIEDPYRGDREDYERCAAIIFKAVQKMALQLGDESFI